jgi:hypothetical protein
VSGMGGAWKPGGGATRAGAEPERLLGGVSAEHGGVAEKGVAEKGVVIGGRGYLQWLGGLGLLASLDRGVVRVWAGEGNAESWHPKVCTGSEARGT